MYELHNQLHMLGFLGFSPGSTCNVDRYESSETRVTINELKGLQKQAKMAWWLLSNASALTRSTSSVIKHCQIHVHLFQIKLNVLL